MKKLLLMLAFALTSVFGAMAAEEVLYTCAFKSANFSKGVSSYTATFDVTTDNVVWTVKNANNNNKGWEYIKMGSKSAASTGTITNKEAFAEPITKVTLTIDAITIGSINSIKLLVSETNDFTNAASYTFTKAEGAQTVEVTNPVANGFYQIAVSCAKATNGTIQLSKVQYYGEKVDDGRTDVSLAWSTTKLNVELGHEFTQPVLTADPAEALASVTYTSGNEDVVSVDEEGNFTVNGTGSTTVTASIRNSETYMNADAVVEVNVIDPNKVDATFDFSTMGYSNQYSLTTCKLVNNIGEITLDFAKNGGTQPAYYTSNSTARLYAKNTLAVTIPSDYYITEIDVDAASGFTTSNVKADAGVVSSKKWTPAKDEEVSKVVFTFSAKAEVKTITVKYAKRLPAAPALTHEWIEEPEAGQTYTYRAAEGCTIVVENMETEVAAYAEAAPEGWEYNADQTEATFTVPAEPTAQNYAGYKIYSVNADGLRSKSAAFGLTENGGVSGIEDIEAEAAEAEYYNMQGVRMQGELAPGMYIRRQGGKAAKVMVK